jgi:hypothetical protein
MKIIVLGMNILILEGESDSSEFITISLWQKQCPTRLVGLVVLTESPFSQNIYFGYALTV